MTETAQPVCAAGATTRVETLLAETRLLIEPTQRAVIETLPPAIRHIVGFHLGWWDAEGREGFGSGGKAVRPTLTIACARGAGGSAQAAIKPAVAVELLHDFSLLHDDIMDGDLTRRHRPTAWAAFGLPMALLTGDALFLLASELVHDGPSGTAIRSAALELCAGQSDDIAFESRAAVGLAECLRMSEAKTGALLGVACQLGALSVADDIELANLYGQFGRHLGIAFQLVDDILGIWGGEAVTGKPVYSDLKSRKKSLPVVAALTSGTAAGHELARLYARTDDLDDRQLSRVADLVEAAGGRAWAETEAQRYRASALDALRAANPKPGAVADLHALAELVANRVC